MTIHLVTPTGGLLDDPAGYGAGHHDAYLDLARLATYDTTIIPLTLHCDTRRGVSIALTEALLYAGRAQPVVSKQSRMVQRAEAGRLVVALRHSGQDLVVLATERLHRLDVALFTAVAAEAGVDLWLVPEQTCRPLVTAALDAATSTRHTVTAALDLFAARPTAGTRRQPLPCEAALPLHVGTQAAPGCVAHTGAAGCVLASFGHALATARTDPSTVRARLHQLTLTLDEPGRWAVYAAARDPYRYAEHAVEQLPLTWQERSRLRLGDLTRAADAIRLPERAVRVPEHLRGVLGAHRDIRAAEGSGPDRPLLVPTDDARRRRWTA